MPIPKFSLTEFIPLQTIYGNITNLFSAGGSINLNCGSFSGTPDNNAISASAPNSSGSSGAGGRIALVSTAATSASAWTGSFVFPTKSTTLNGIKTVLKALGCSSITPAILSSGGAGTIFLKHSGLTYGELIADNSGLTVGPVALNGVRIRDR